jgi:hypothetical protein
MTDEATASIAINADKAAVMDVIADFEAYPQWAHYVKRADVVAPGADARARRVRFVLDAGVIKDDYTLEYDWEGDDAVHWHLVQGRILKEMAGSYALSPLGGGTLVDYRLAVALHIPMPGIVKRQAEKVIVDMALKELKNRVEG